MKWLLSLFVLGWFGLPVGAQESPTNNNSLRLDLTNKDSPAVFLGGNLITRYVPTSNTKPILYPLRSASGLSLTRNYPVADATPAEKKDHPHHRSFWFSYGEINGIDYWSEEAKDKQGYIVTTSVDTSESEDAGVVLTTEWEWQGPDRSPQAASRQVFAFSKIESGVLIDCDIVLTATEADLHFGDTKEGAFAVRVGGAMKVDAKQGGAILDSAGAKNDVAWGKDARWVQYVGPAITNLPEVPTEGATKELEFATGGITMLVHPTTFGYPGRWHVRTYGLFAHNPFGVSDFVSSLPAKEGSESERVGGFMLHKGDKLHVRYGVLLHDGELAAQVVDKIWQDFADRQPDLDEPQEFFRTNCPMCNKRVKVPPKLAGKSVPCPKCGSAINIPLLASTQPEDLWLDDSEATPAGTEYPSAGVGESKTPAKRDEPFQAKPLSAVPTPVKSISADSEDDFKFIEDTPSTSKPAPVKSVLDEIDLGEFDLSALGPPPKVSDDLFDAGAISSALNDAKSDSDEFRFACKVCGTALYARPSQIGDMTRCPDCYSEFSIPRPAPKVLTKTAFRPDESPAVAFQPSTGKNRRDDPSTTSADEFLRKAELELDNEDEKQRIESYDFDTHGFMQRAFGFLTDFNVYVMALAPGFLFGLVLFAAQAVWDLGAQKNETLATLGVVLVMSIFGAPLLAGTMVNGLAILEATANKQRRVSQWPAFNITESFGEIFMLIIAVALAGVPGGLLGWGASALNMPYFLGIAITLFSIWFFFPIIVLGMLDNQAITEPYSSDVVASMGKKPDSWAGMYTLNALASILFFVLIVTMVGSNGAMKMLSAMVLPLVIFFVFRQLGNLAANIGDVTNIAFDAEHEEAEE